VEELASDTGALDLTVPFSCKLLPGDNICHFLTSSALLSTSSGYSISKFALGNVVV
jgi:hypothetical protein